VTFFFAEIKVCAPTFVHSLDDFATMVTAMTLFDTELYVKRSGIAELLVYDELTLKLRRQLTVPGLGEQSVFGMAACKTNRCLFISDNKNSVVLKVNLSVSSGTPKSTRWSVMKGPAGLSVNRACNVLVASQDSKKIQEFTSTGSLVREISDINGFWHAVELSNENLAVSRSSPASDICVMTKKGHVIRRYTDTSVGPMKNPRCLVADKHGFLVVTDYDNDRILVVNPSLTEARKLQLSASIPTHSVTKPLALCWDLSRGRMFVAENALSHNNRVLVFDNVFDVAPAFGT
jgi:DNA-binding beta-propeller fold protein YncE